jgi:hypothetical protein
MGLMRQSDLLYSRREALQLALWGAAGVMLGSAGRLGAQTKSQPAATGAAFRPGKAKSVIQIWQWGGASHLDTFDPKPEAGNDYCGPFKSPIETNVKGIRISEVLPLLAKQADKYSLIRTLTHGINAHETAAYLVQTGRQPGGGLVCPSAGAVVSHFKGYGAGYKGLVPPYIVLTELQGRFSEVGFLPSSCKPFATGGDPQQARFVVEGVIAQGITDQRQADRRKLLADLDTLGKTLPNDAQLAAVREAQNTAYDLIMGDAGKVFDLSQEKAELRDKYGRTKFGQSCLVARRLVERGVPYITINFNGWDTHKDNFNAMRRLGGDLDKGLATLLQDLADRGLLESTIVWCCGEFGRTPKVQWEPPWNGGRGHYGDCFSALVAGGGFKGGQVVGTSDDKGEKVKDRPVYPCDLLGSIYELLGIDPAATLPHPQKVVHVVPTAEDKEKSAGRLKEIM